jgi:hypothetical protein
MNTMVRMSGNSEENHEHLYMTAIYCRNIDWMKPIYKGARRNCLRLNKILNKI